MKLEFLDLLLDARKASGFRNKLKFILAASLYVVAVHTRSRYGRLDEFVNILLGNTSILIDGNRFYLADFGSVAIASPRFEDFVNPWLQLNDGDVLIDVGAHIGKYSIPFAARSKKSLRLSRTKRPT